MTIRLPLFARYKLVGLLVVALVAYCVAFYPTRPVYAAGVVGNGTPASCTGNAFESAVISGGLVTFNCGAGQQSIKVNTNVINANTDATVDGGGTIILNGEDLRQIFYVLDNGKLTLNNITLADGSFGNGGAIYINSQGEATLNSSFIISSQADGGSGGAIYNKGKLTLIRTTIGAGSATGDGGAIYNNGGTALVQESTIINNDAVNGGGLANNGGVLTLDRVAVRSNRATQKGGGLYNFSDTVHITNTTIADNRAARGGGLHSSSGATTSLLNVTLNQNKGDEGGGIWADAGTTTLKNTIVANSRNQADSDSALNCDGPTLTSQGHNLISDNTCVPNPSSVSDQLGTDPKLAQFINDNGGFTRSFLPLTGSPAIDKGDNNGCPAVDQRSAQRPGNAICDVGAVEANGFLPRAYLPLIHN